MNSISNRLRRSLTAVAVAGLTALGVLVTGSAQAATYTSGHYDLVLVPECSSLTGLLTGGNFEIENHDDPDWEDDEPSFEFNGWNGPAVGFEVEWDADENCTPTTVNVTLASGSGSGSVFANGYFGYSGTVGNSNPLPLNSGNGYHNDPTLWAVSPGSDVYLAFTFTPSSGTPVTSGQVLNITA